MVVGGMEVMKQYGGLRVTRELRGASQCIEVDGRG